MIKRALIIALLLFAMLLSAACGSYAGIKTETRLAPTKAPELPEMSIVTSVEEDETQKEIDRLWKEIVEMTPDPHPGHWITEAPPENDISRSGAVRSDLESTNYVLNTNTMVFHRPYCYHVDDIFAANKQEYYGSRESLIAAGYSPCGTCNP